MIFLTTMIGFLGGFIPELLKLWNKAQDHKHEMEKMGLQMQAQAAGHQQRLEEINTQADVEAERIALEASKPTQVAYTGNTWVDALIGVCNAIILLVNGLVRPTVTYCYFWLYALIKWAQYQAVLAGGQTTYNAILGMWGEEDKIQFAAVLGFWFGSRTMKWMKEKGR